MRPKGIKNKTYTSPQGYEYGCSKEDLLYIPRSKADALDMLLDMVKPAMQEHLSRIEDNRVRYLKQVLYNELTKKLKR